MVLFDVPVAKGSLRNKLRSYLRNRGFGCLQKSVWVTPDPVTNEREILSGNSVDVESLILLEGRPCAGESDAEIVAGAWDFDVINERYRRQMKILEQRPRGSLNSETAAKAFRRWTNLERHAWQVVASLDPFLPETLLPSGYLGRVAWKKRLEVMAKATSQMQESSVAK